MKSFKQLFGALVLMFGSSAVGATFTPGFELDDWAGGDDIVKSGNVLTVNAIASFYLNGVDAPQPVTNTLFSMTIDATSPTQPGGFGTPIWNFGTGTFDLTQGGDLLLTGTVDSFTLFTTGSFAANLSYTGGSLQGAYTGGSTEGGILQTNLANPVLADLTADFTMDGIESAKLGPVPVPPALALFLPALGGLLAFRRRSA